jgi:uracil-DNA glycosylase family 4
VLQRIEAAVVRCARCPRLRAYCADVAQVKKRAYRDQTYWGRPVPGFGDPRARLWILGLAPGAHGSNRTGRMFTGDASGDWLYGALHRHGFASQPHSVSRDDGQTLHDTYISAAARCAPPGNKPSPAEIDHCADFLLQELEALQRVRVVLALGKIAFDAALRLLDENGHRIARPRPRFGHAVELVTTRASGDRPAITVLASYHPSRQNTQTGKLTLPMWNAIFTRARQLIEPPAAS